MWRANSLALLISILGIVAAFIVTDRIFERMPHIEDEEAYVWQAKAIARGFLTIPSPPHAESYLVPFVVDYRGQRFGKYPPGWPALLGVAVWLGIRSWLNPLLAGLGVWLTYRLGKHVFSEAVGLLAAGLTVTSPFFLMNSGSLLAHPFGLVLSAAFVLAWLEAFDGSSSQRSWLSTLVAALALGVLILTRPMTAVGVALPFALHGIFLLYSGDRQVRCRLLTFGAVALALASLYFLWQYAVTGNALLNPYTLWWPYDKVGFGLGYGVLERGHNLLQALYNAGQSLLVGCRDLFGWGMFSWIFLPFGLWAVRRNRRAWLVGGVFASLVFVYLAYWIGSELFGPRYYYEGLYSLTLFSAVGIAFFAGWPTRPGESRRAFVGWERARPWVISLSLAALVGYNLLAYAPKRLEGMRGLYGIERAALRPFQLSQKALAPALIIVHAGDWMPYGALLDLEDPFLTTPFIFAWSIDQSKDAALPADFPARAVYHYYPEEPGKFYTQPKEGE